MRFASLIFPAVLLGTSLLATTVVVFVNPGGMVIGTDSKFTQHDASLGYSPLREQEGGTTKKFVIVQNRIAIVAVGATDFGNNNTHYNFLTWMNDLQRRLPANISVDDFVHIIERESSSVFDIFNVWLKNGLAKPESAAEMFKLLAQYIIAGYDGKVGKLYIIEFYINWDEHRLIGPRTTVLQPDSQAPGYVHMHMFGYREAIADIRERHSYAYDEAFRRSPKAFTGLLGTGTFSFNDSVTITRNLIAIEETINPGDVGGIIRIVTILPSGANEEIEPVTALPKSKTGDSKKKP